MNKALTVVIALLGVTLSTAQTIQMEFPHLAGKIYDLILFQGDQQVKAVQGSVPADGKFTMVIPKEYAPYTGMSRWLLTTAAEPVGLDIPISGKDFSLSCLIENPSKQDDIRARNNTDVALLNSLFSEQQSIVNKAEAVNAVLQAYDKSDKSYALFEKEYAKQQTAYRAFQQNISKSKEYAAKVFNTFGFTRGIGTELHQTEEAKAKNIASAMANELDLKVLYTSGHWTNSISNWVDIHTLVLKDKNAFIADFKKMESKTDAKRFTDFAGRVAYFLTQKGQDDYITAITPAVRESSKIVSYEGSMQAYIKATVGSQAPDIMVQEHIGKVEDHNHTTAILKSTDLATNGFNKTLVLFYESGCGPCETLLQQLPGNYENLKAKGIRVIAIAADTDEKVFKDRAKDFPWKDTFCDYEGKAGINFQNYGAVGTPTIFLLDKSGKIEAKMAGLDEVLDRIK